MIDISHKKSTLRYARAQGKLFATPEVIQRVKEGRVPKGDVAHVARAAGIQAGKKASDWMVFCHPMPMDWVEISMEITDDGLLFTAEAKSVWKTGVEMETVAAVTGALLNAYDMLKPFQQDLSMGDIRLLEKSGGKSDYSSD